LGLRCGVTKHLGSIVDDAVTVTIQDDPGVIAVRLGLCPGTRTESGAWRKLDALGPRGEPEPIPRDVDQDRRRAAARRDLRVAVAERLID
jgi:hypothetical protein